ncbi:MAG: DUF3343 domain-containing protein [Gaiellales bacterium]|nr:DUF3343 domain-containing protein [Gaiellales bacterium]
MPATEARSVVVFHTTSAAIKADKAARQAGLETRLVPTPRHLSSDCGLALRFARVDRAKMEALLREAGVEPAGIHDL